MSFWVDLLPDLCLAGVGIIQEVTVNLCPHAPKKKSIYVDSNLGWRSRKDPRSIIDAMLLTKVSQPNCQEDAIQNKNFEVQMQ